jgi:inner membrane transporter RhtA
LCSAVPMIADLKALRRVPARFFGVFMSVNPVFAALTGLIVLGQSLAAADWLAIAVIVTVNAVSASQAHRSPSGLHERHIPDAAPRPRKGLRPDGGPSQHSPVGDRDERKAGESGHVRGPEDHRGSERQPA